MVKSVHYRQTRTNFVLYRQESIDATNKKVKAVCNVLQHHIPSDLYHTILDFCYPTVVSAQAKWNFSKVVVQVRNSFYICSKTNEGERLFFTPEVENGVMVMKEVWWGCMCTYCGGFLQGRSPCSPTAVCHC
jgi:hypothetical protein